MLDNKSFDTSWAGSSKSKPIDLDLIPSDLEDEDYVGSESGPESENQENIDASDMEEDYPQNVRGKDKKKKKTTTKKTKTPSRRSTRTRKLTNFYGSNVYRKSSKLTSNGDGNDSSDDDRDKKPKKHQPDPMEIGGEDEDEDEEEEEDEDEDEDEGEESQKESEEEEEEEEETEEETEDDDEGSPVESEEKKEEKDKAFEEPITGTQEPHEEIISCMDSSSIQGDPIASPEPLKVFELTSGRSEWHQVSIKVRAFARSVKNANYGITILCKIDRLTKGKEIIKTIIGELKIDDDEEKCKLKFKGEDRLLNPCESVYDVLKDHESFPDFRKETITNDQWSHPVCYVITEKVM